MKALLTTLLICCTLGAFAQAEYETSRDPENNQLVMKGKLNFLDIRKEPSFAWFRTGVENYTPDSASLAYLRKYFKGYELIVFMGTWCDDSQNLIPKLYKTLDLAGFPLEKVTLYGTDRQKNTLNVESKIYKIERVPTIILMDGNFQRGRITETVRKSVEADLAALVKQAIEDARNAQSPAKQ